MRESEKLNIKRNSKFYINHHELRMFLLLIDNSFKVNSMKFSWGKSDGFHEKMIMMMYTENNMKP